MFTIPRPTTLHPKQYPDPYLGRPRDQRSERSFFNLPCTGSGVGWQRRRHGRSHPDPSRGPPTMLLVELPAGKTKARQIRGLLPLSVVQATSDHYELRIQGERKLRWEIPVHPRHHEFRFDFNYHPHMLETLLDRNPDPERHPPLDSPMAASFLSPSICFPGLWCFLSDREEGGAARYISAGMRFLLGGVRTNGEIHGEFGSHARVGDLAEHATDWARRTTRRRVHELATQRGERLEGWARIVCERRRGKRAALIGCYVRLSSGSHPSATRVREQAAQGRSGVVGPR
jgi:hypothetical protein